MPITLYLTYIFITIYINNNFNLIYINNNFISFFDTINEAAAYLNVSHVSVVRVCKKQRDSCKNHIINYCD